MFLFVISKQLARPYSVQKSMFGKTSTELGSKISFKNYAKRTFLSMVLGACVYDGYNDFEVCASIGRFMRSLKIAAIISMDYTWSLYGLKNGAEYEKVNSFNLIS